jgi:hypothetical protein
MTLHLVAGPFSAQEIVAAHDGQVAIQSEVGHGATFTITLPLAVTEEARQRALPRPCCPFQVAP